MFRSKSLNPSSAVRGFQASISSKEWMVRPPEMISTPSSLEARVSEKQGERMMEEDKRRKRKMEGKEKKGRAGRKGRAGERKGERMVMEKRKEKGKEDRVKTKRGRMGRGKGKREKRERKGREKKREKKRREDEEEKRKGKRTSPQWLERCSDIDMVLRIEIPIDRNLHERNRKGIGKHQLERNEHAVIETTTLSNGTARNIFL